LPSISSKKSATAAAAKIYIFRYESLLKWFSECGAYQSHSRTQVRKVEKSICKDYLTRFCVRLEIPVNPIYISFPNILFDAFCLMPIRSEMILKLVGFVGFNNNFWFLFLLPFFFFVSPHNKVEGAARRERSESQTI
jgi:hypothetical protein